jgi:K+-transporting ATPase A subunit
VLVFHLRLREGLRQSRAIIACMLALFLIGGATSLWAEYQPNRR